MKIKFKFLLIAVVGCGHPSDHFDPDASADPKVSLETMINAFCDKRFECKKLDADVCKTHMKSRIKFSNQLPISCLEHIQSSTCDKFPRFKQIIKACIYEKALETSDL